MIKRTVILLCMILTLLNGSIEKYVEAGDKTGKYQHIDTYLQDQMKSQAISGLAYAILEGDEVVHMKAFGRANYGKSLTIQTPMKIASLSKSFTSLAIMQLVDQGKVELDAPIKEYIPWFRLKDEEAAAGITIRHLLNQTSGLPSEVVIGKGLLNKSLEDTVRLMKQLDLNHPPGTKFEYSNLNYISLGLLIEYVSGMPLADYIETQILTPLNMNTSFTSIEGAKKSGLSKDFTSWFGMLLPTKTIMSNLPNFLASGYMVSSIEDMGKYLLMYMNKGTLAGQKLVSEKGIQTLQTASETAEMYLDDEFFGHYAMGWWQRKVQGTVVIGHSGDLLSAARTDMYIIPEKKIGVVILTNTNTGTFAPGDSHISTDGVISILLGKEPQVGETQSYKFYYMIFDMIVIITLVGLLSYGIRLKRNLGNRYRISTWTLIMTALQILLPIIIFIALPKFLGAPSWGFFFCVQSDMTCVLLFTMLTIFAFGLTKIVWMLLIFKKKVKTKQFPN
ncbi:CubicO group peptidase (beta-lactamase class C family) [Ureibacillus xyleni]|uniref:CubicO group peptidase (Beta-lactamase class C family) n=1 Tax=Ureibacillus xyleni TaxID=614648 RepID=A0A285T2U0_9BACL|nr:serine hydrolase domain-containing protein [Ureibacillus xyleni]SOC13426.1 CubicO group peptidase (beta-lactamase class C family) [Ureibacillus xyleni]